MTPPQEPSGAGSGDASAGSLPPLPAGLTVPDDARDLEGDRAAWLREQQRTESVQQWQRRGRRFLGRRWEQHGISGPIVVVALLLVGIVGTLAVAFIPQPPERPAAAPLARSAVSASSAERGLLPEVPVRTARGSRPARDARPAVVALVPATCDCEQVLHEAFRQASEFGLRLWLVGEAGQLMPARRLAATVGNGSSEVAEDATGTLHATYARGSLALVLVHTDGVVHRVVRDPSAPLRLEGHLAVLTSPGNPG